MDAFEKLCSTLNLEAKGYEIATCQKFINELLPRGEIISNKGLKKLLIERFGDQNCFTYRNDYTKPEMFFSSAITSSNMAEVIRNVDPVTECAKSLRHECKEYDFRLDKAYCDADDLKCSFGIYTRNRPKTWDIFFKNLIDSTVLSKKRQRVCDSVFQLI